ncbi:tRNA lysidine(34) synthetase TilS [Oceanihabitans sp. 2_MG-2023]|uniref:tRNA lysidine(34) synthetase TilS n=1 Tax=Oceanihabitans sp. 2_MG-2023 TaxID=3062661 RepID=UPI0026E17111|nr:tRNA lysidine(34) synthetase TilS [Oceanihabitans sp. 2_MG-2023]MDO6597303.1 tRNA lysidine(34) synthetase TilS [Oceanihabitans sp. 2_MG-2023]
MPIKLLNKFQKHIHQNLPFLNESKLLITISGGIDSVILTHLCHQAKLHFSLAHCNFNLRGKESDADQDFVMQLAEDLDVEVFIESFETESYAKTNKLSTQMAARELRYNWFQELSEQLHFDYILTAHHADDNLETFLINLTRGTGLDGLTGIPEVNENIVRPLLKFTREEIENFAKENNFKWREDSSNASTKYLRNKLRQDVIPILKAMNSQLLSNFQTTQDNLQDAKSIIQDAVHKVEDKVLTVENAVIKLNIDILQKQSNTKAYLFQLLKDFNFTEWNDIYNLLEAQSGKQVFSSTHRLLKDRKHLLLTEILNVTSSAVDSLLIKEDEKQIETSLGVLSFETTSQIHESNKSILQIDKDLLKFPLTIRKWQKGDYFYPLGMQGKKKLSKYFKDEKYSLIEKEKALVLCSGDDVVWVINKRADNRYKVTEKTKNILKITVQ